MKFSVFATGALSLAIGSDAFGSKSAQRSAVATVSNTTANTSPLPPRQDPWYTAPPNFAQAAPGAILKIRAAPGLVTVTANTSAAYNILYRTTDSQYRPSWAVTTLFVPKTPDSLKFLSYQIPYDSADLDASPSYSLYSSPEADISSALGKGWFVASPDYEGPLASFVAGVQSGHATLDSVRAVLNSGLGLNTTAARYAMWGYSGGALASEWAAELQVQYAPELKFAGAALGGLTPNVTSVLLTVNKKLTAGLIPAGIVGLASQYPELQEYLAKNINQNGTYNATGFYATKNYTLLQDVGAYLNQDIGRYFKGGLDLIYGGVAQYVINRDGIMGYHGVPQMPVFAYKAIGDDVSPVNDTDILVARYCNVGATINYQRNTVGDHETEEINGDPRAVAFLTKVLGGQYNATGCLIQNVSVNLTSSN